MKTTGRKSFVVQIMNTQNSTWQGTVTWTDGKQQQPFRSALELIRLLDSAISSDSEDKCEESEA